MMFFLCTHNSASLGLFPSAPARVHSNIDIDMEGGGGGGGDRRHYYNMTVHTCRAQAQAYPLSQYD